MVDEDDMFEQKMEDDGFDGVVYGCIVVDEGLNCSNVVCKTIDETQLLG